MTWLLSLGGELFKWLLDQTGLIFAYFAGRKSVKNNQLKKTVEVLNEQRRILTGPKPDRDALLKWLRDRAER